MRGLGHITGNDLQRNLDAETKRKTFSLSAALVETLSAIITPIIPAMFACGFIKTLAVLFIGRLKADEANKSTIQVEWHRHTVCIFPSHHRTVWSPRNLKQNMAVSLVIVVLL